ncbi:MAG: hypothetical protein J1G06_09890, partial [Oscillospiraceae bacterium]|nr:hypothetical protein [Oscillospiraceae bacterium]
MATKNKLSRKEMYERLKARASGNSLGLSSNTKTKQEYFKNLYNRAMGDDTAADRYLAELKKQRSAESKATEATKAETENNSPSKPKLTKQESEKLLASEKGPVDPAKTETQSPYLDYKNSKANEVKTKNALFEDSLLIDTSNPGTPLRRPSVEEQKARIERAAKK